MTDASGLSESSNKSESLEVDFEKTGSRKGNKKELLYPPGLLWLLVLATIPGALAGLFLNDYAETVFRHPLLVAGTLSGVGLLLFLADKKARHLKKLKNISWMDAFLIGVAQALAIVPGVSRSGSTITTGLFLGYARVSAARFSFLLSAPIIFGATVFKFPELYQAGLGVMELVGIASAAVSGYLAIFGLMKLVERVSYQVFFWYRLALAILILALWFLR